MLIFQGVGFIVDLSIVDLAQKMLKNLDTQIWWLDLDY